jgi:hypothetical protein
LIRNLSLAFLFSILTLPLFGQGACNLTITVTCTPGAHGASSQCTASTTNIGTNTCAGEFYVGWFAQVPSHQIEFVGATNGLGLGECIDTSDIAEFEFEFGFNICIGGASLAPGQSFRASTGVRGPATEVPLTGFTVVADPNSDPENPVTLGQAFAVANVEQPTCQPRISAPPVTTSGVEYTVSWSAVSNPNATFVVEESTTRDFSSGVTSRQVAGLSTIFRHDVAATTSYFYRVRPSACAGGSPEVSEVVATVVQAPQPQTRNPEGVVPFGSTTPIDIQVFIPGGSGKGAIAGQETTFTAGTDKPYLAVTPSSGILPATGTTVTVKASPAGLPAGANTGTLTVTANGATVATTPITISLVTPVSPVKKTTPSPTTLVIPVVTHVNTATGQFLSDVRITNAGTGAAKYQVSLTPTGTNAVTTPSKATPVTVDGGGTIALNDIAKNFFGFGATGSPSDIGFGSLEIRQLESSSLTLASSRTYASTPSGTFGQFIAAVPFAKFATRVVEGLLPGEAASTKFSLQQVAQSAKFRTNLGLVEGAGQPASGKIRIYNNAGIVQKEVDFNLQPGEHQQINNFIAVSGVSNLDDGRIELEVTSQTGAVTAYASVLDNLTTDPLAVMPVDASKIRASRYVLPGMAAVNNFFSDVRVLNGGTEEALVTATFYPQGNLPFQTAQAFRIAPREIKAFDNVLPTLFNVANGGGSIVFTTTSPTSLVVTGRTYSLAPNGGTYGQFIPGVTRDEGVARTDRALHILQLEHSALFRTNIGLAETSGEPAKVEVQLVLPDSKTTPVLSFELAPNEFRQFSLANFGAGNSLYNVRAVVKVVEGNGRVTAYGSVIDNATADPTYVPAQ